jgi:glycosyltransferase involved in cell wall biosynthesis
MEANAIAGGLRFRLEDVEVRVFTHGRLLRAWATAQMREFQPDVILASTDDPAHVMLDPALHISDTRIVYLLRALIALPFGPCSPHPNGRATEVLRSLDGVTAVSEYVAAYARSWGQLEAVHVPISLPDRTTYHALGNLDNPFVTLINPCAGKGLSIFVGVASRMPHINFAAVPSWGTTARDLELLGTLPNVTLLPPVDDCDEIYRKSRVMLVPSLWAEARSRVPLEAMARGIPVLASDVGGMDEAMLGMDYMLPVCPAERYRPAADRSMVPVADIPPQDVEPWAKALTDLLSDPTRYNEVSGRVRTRAGEYVRTVSVAPFEAYLQEIIRSPRKSRPAAYSRSGEAHPSSGLSAERRSLLVSRLKKRRQTESKARRHHDALD